MRLSLRTSRWRLHASVAAVWYLGILVLYTRMIGGLAPGHLRLLVDDVKALVLWQGVGFLLLSTLVCVLRPALVGRFAAVYLGLSTVALLAFSRDLGLILGFIAFSVWWVLAANSVRLGIRRLVGPSHAGWGLAASVMYAVFVPLSFVLGIFRVMTPWSVGLVAALGAAFGASDLFRNRRRTVAAARRWLAAVDPIGAAAAGALWILLALSFVWASTAETESDSIRVHLPYIQQVAEDRGFEAEYADIWRLTPKAIQSSYAGAFVLGSVRASKWLSWFAVVALTLLIGEEVARRSGGNANLGLLAGAAALACPLLMHLATTLYNDHVTTLLCVTAFIALSRSFPRGAERGILLSAFVLAGALQAKYNALIFGVIWALLLVVHRVRERGLAAGLGRCVLPLFACAVFASPWYVYTFTITGNPFFPWFDQWFDSPYWPDGFSTSFNLDQFSLGGGLADRLLFPWTLTFKTSMLGDGVDGTLGFQLLALVPFVFLLFALRRRIGLDLGIAGLAIFGSVCLVTPYPRYWLPAYFLMLIPLFAALGESAARIEWRPKRFMAPIFAGVVFLALLAHVPFFGATWRNWPWEAYSQELSTDDWLAARFHGYPAIQQLNAALDRQADRVLATGYDAVYTIRGDAFEFPFWHTRMRDITGEDSLEAFLDRHDIGYWIVNYSGMASTYFDSELSTSSRYWTDERLVAASGTVAVYDLRPPFGGARFHLIDSRRVETVQVPEDRGEGTGGEGWRDLYAADPERASQGLEQAIRIAPPGHLLHTVPRPAASDVCRARIRIGGGPGATVIMTWTWLDADGHAAGQITGNASLQGGERVIDFFGTPPPETKHVRLSLRPWQSAELVLHAATVDFFAVESDADSPEDGSEGESILLDGNFTDSEARHWQANARADFRAGRVELRAGGLITQVLPAAAVPGRRYLLRVDARSLEASAGVLRLQAVWLPEGGWTATDSDGKPLRVVEAEQVHPGRTLQPHTIEISKTDNATSLAVFLHNDGDVSVEILQARLVSLEDP